MEPNASANAVRHKATKRKQIFLKDKLDIIEQVEKGKKQVDVAVAYGLSKQTVSTIINAKEAVLAKKVSGDLQPKRFRLREASYPDVEEALLMWLRDARSRNIPVNGLLLRKREEQLAVVLNQEQFQCSEGWLSRLKSRHAIAFKCLFGKSASVDDTVVADWIADVLPAHLEGYTPQDVFNADESGIFYKFKPGKTFCFGDDTCHGGKKSKERISVLFCCNMDGSEKEKLLQKRDSVIDLKFAVQVLSTVWAQIQPGIVKNCFKKAGFRVDSDCTDCLPEEYQPDPGVWSAVEEAFGSQ
nr:tigger transposable element-derived protein 4-like [Rhipicephalus microplus]